MPTIGLPKSDHRNTLIAHKNMNVEIGNEAPRSFISRNICFEFSVQCLQMNSSHNSVSKSYWTRPLTSGGNPFPNISDKLKFRCAFNSSFGNNSFISGNT
jgi:hypothetical protein